MRINARLEGELADKLEFLKEHTHLSISEIVKKAIILLYDQEYSRAKSPIEIFEECGFVGSGEGLEDLSKEYKTYLKEEWSEKYYR